MIEGTGAKLNHVAIIMDGNGRWANERAHRRVWGHVRGSGVVSNIVEEADDLGLKALTLYAFSTENWSRPLTEVKTLFSLLKKFLKKERARILKNKIRFKVIGDIDKLPEETKKLIVDLEDETKTFEGLKLTFAFGYGGRDEIAKAVNKFIAENPGQPITQDAICANMMAPEIGDVDLLIRTGGDQRISNFLLWQSAYAELFFTPTKWPDFTREEFKKIVVDVLARERRFGNVAATDSLSESLSIAEKNKKELEELQTRSH
ncbi:MAG: di-trans,poly-cis-decaprenylcistransferase [Deltaproteobacteria bacterium]|nr:MAG: di-trans,poly-cis-decaprenylcistransferase [Deltaproteobacteria bacterium]